MRLYEIAARPSPLDNPNFRAWFKDSRVVDANGQPRVVYHGTRADIERFEHGHARPNGYFWDDNGLGFFFDAHPGRRSDSGNWGGAAGFAGVRQTDGETVAATGATIMPVYLSLQCPYVFSYTEYIDALKSAGSGEALKEQLEVLGNDGVIRLSPAGEPNHFVAFYPEQIKSAVGNRGTYDPTSAHIAETRP